MAALILPFAAPGCWALAYKSIEDTASPDGAEYVNYLYGFAFRLPESWTGYTVREDLWQAVRSDSLLGVVPAGEGPVFRIVHPLSTTDSPRQEIPVMVFTVEEWLLLEADLWHIGAAPVNPAELGRNESYVLGLPARFDFGCIEGFEEVRDILAEHPLRTFSPGEPP